MGKQSGKKKRKKKGELPRTVTISGDQVTGGKRVIHTGGSYFEGEVTVRNGYLIGRDHIIDTSSQVQTLFQPIYEKIENRLGITEADRDKIRTYVEEIEAEAKKGDQADETFLAKRLANLKRMAPDIWDVVLAALHSPIHGFKTVAAKVAKKMTEAEESEEDNSQE